MGFKRYFTFKKMLEIARNLAQIRAEIEASARACHRDPKHIKMIAVSKKQPISSLEAAYEAGVRDFGESYVQEALPKLSALKDKKITWHFIGPIQRNKIKSIATSFDWVHSVASWEMAEALAKHRDPTRPPLAICIQINIDREPSKSGIFPETLPAFLDTIHRWPTLSCEGLMILPRPDHLLHPPNAFIRAHHLWTLSCSRYPMRTLSMGMSADFNEAIKAGSTCLRIGQRLWSPIECIFA